MKPGIERPLYGKMKVDALRKNLNPYIRSCIGIMILAGPDRRMHFACKLSRSSPQPPICTNNHLLSRYDCKSNAALIEGGFQYLGHAGSLQYTAHSRIDAVERLCHEHRLVILVISE